MGKRISFDHESGFGYIYVFTKKYKYTIEETEELEVNPFISLDIDTEGKIVGLELFGEEALGLKNLVKEKNIYTKNEHKYSFRMNEKEVVSKYHFLGIDFLFSKEDYKGFIGFDIIDLERYPENKL
ncbi:DUF2283 domain-containing protein [Fervidibacillus halotolerans]|uniref:DUF2283 domain-containing protein n=1 Tax=Fervidibacillus halotolerans TaxID=2980027 RepID=A0A9E8RZX6_9BACI|nr:DUF2283 domain-containing protein [Fervidibacillus halotolerans]WAA12077.1 DUF2283 domain-containing protein [Fervidibacillus halotolerans]